MTLPKHLDFVDVGRDHLPQRDVANTNHVVRAVLVPVNALNLLMPFQKMNNAINSPQCDSRVFFGRNHRCRTPKEGSPKGARRGWPSSQPPGRNSINACH